MKPFVIFLVLALENIFTVLCLSQYTTIFFFSSVIPVQSISHCLVFILSLLNSDLDFSLTPTPMYPISIGDLYFSKAFQHIQDSPKTPAKTDPLGVTYFNKWHRHPFGWAFSLMSSPPQLQNHLSPKPYCLASWKCLEFVLSHYVYPSSHHRSPLVLTAFASFSAPVIDGRVQISI